MLYTISDPHLSLSCEKPMDIFGAKWLNHADRLAQNWQKTVKDGDTVVIPGDISWAMTLEEARADLEFINALPGYKIIGKGNHDYWWDTASKLNQFKQQNGFDTIDFMFNNAFYSQGKIICGTRGWICEESMAEEDKKLVRRENLRLRISLDEAAKLKKLYPDAEIIPFLHFPPATPSAVQEEVMDTLLEYGVERVYYGHLHSVMSESRLAKTKYGVLLHLCSADYLGFEPLRID